MIGLAFDFDFSEALEETMRKLEKKDKSRLFMLNKKMKEIASCDENSIQHYKNLLYGLSDFKRVHIDGSFVLLFKVFLKENYIFFERLEHHDKVYKK